MDKILYICPSVGVGGAETFIQQTFHHQSDQVQNHYLLFETGPLEKKMNAMGARVHILKARPHLKSHSDRKQVSQEIKNLVNEHNFKLIHSTMAYGALFAAWPSKQMKIPHVWFQHGPVSGWMDRLAAILPHQGLIVNSHYTAQKQRKLENPLRFLIPRKTPIEKILLGADPMTLSPENINHFRTQLSDQHHFPPSDKIITMLCRIQKQKGVHILLEALIKISRSNSLEGLRVVIWGDAFKGSEYLNAMNKIVKQHHLPVIFAGHCNSPEKALSVSNIVVNSSIIPESFGLTLVEGMMAGCVPVAPAEGGPLETISNGKNGMTFKPQDSTSLAETLMKLLKDDELRTKLAIQAKETALNKFTAQRAIQHLEKFHSKIINSY